MCGSVHSATAERSSECGGRAGSQILKGLPRLLDEGPNGKPVADPLGPPLVLLYSCKGVVLRVNNTEWVGGQKKKVEMITVKVVGKGDGEGQVIVWKGPVIGKEMSAPSAVHCLRKVSHAFGMCSSLQ